MRMFRVVSLILAMVMLSSITARTSRAQSAETLSPIVDASAYQGASRPNSATSAIGDGTMLIGMPPGMPVPAQRPIASAPSQINSIPMASAPRAVATSPYPMQANPGFAAAPAYYGAPQGYAGMPQMGMPPMGMQPGMPPMGMQPGMPPMGMQPMGMAPAGMYGPMQGVMPAGYGEPTPPVPQPYGESGGAMGACPYCGGQGCEYCQGGDGGYGDPGVVGGVLGGLGHWFLPYAEGGRCAPRWYDITADAMYMKRAEVGERVEFAYFTRLALGGTVVLSTDNLKYDEEFGLRFTGSLQVMPGANLEFTYFGLFDWDTTAVVDDPTNNLFSVYSGFGENPINGFDETDQSQQQSLRAANTIDNFEINLRKRWQGPNCRLQGSWLFGSRYIYLLDDLDYFTLGRNDLVLGTPVGQSDTFIRTANNIFTLQAGGDLWANIVPGVSVGGELKAGVGGVRSKYNSSAVSTNLIVPAQVILNEEDHNNDIVGMVEANVMFIWRLNPNWTLRGGFQAMYIDGVSLSLDNFNPTNPFVGGRTLRPIDDNGSVLYHGGFAGLEWMW